MKKIIVIAAMGLIGYSASAQDIHFAQGKNMQKWYNSSLRNEDDERSLTLNFRSVSYKQLVAFKSVAALADIPLVSKAARQSEDKKGYFGVAGGFAVDQSNQGILRNTTAMIGVSYHLPIDLKRETFISMGLQGSNFESRINMNGVTTPDQFDKYGMIPGSAANDPSTMGKVSFLSVNAGVSVSHSSANKAWYVGASARHINRPQANLKGSEEYKLPATAGFQAGYRKTVGNDSYGTDVFTNFKAGAYEHVGSVYYNYVFDATDFDGSIGASVAYRYQDAIIPGLQMQMKKTILAFNYDMAVGKKKSGINRVAFEIGLKQVF